MPQPIVPLCTWWHWDIAISILPFITHVVRVNTTLVSSPLNSYYHCFLLYHTDNIPDYPLEWKGWESHIVQCCLKRRCPDYWVQLICVSGSPTKLHFPTWPPQIPKLFIISHFSQESREKEGQYLQAITWTHESLFSMTFYWCVGLCSIFTPQSIHAIWNHENKTKSENPE